MKNTIQTARKEEERETGSYFSERKNEGRGGMDLELRRKCISSCRESMPICS
jgi:hypothetical protein